MFFKKILDQSNTKPRKTWVDKFYNISTKSWPEKNEIKMYRQIINVKSVDFNTKKYVYC